MRVDHGPATDFNKGFIDATELSADGTWTFRVLIVAPDSPVLIAAAENVRPNGLGDSESLIALEPADLDQEPWQLQVLEQEGRAVIRFNRQLFQTTSRAEADPHFGCYVFPQAVRELATWLLRDPDVLADEPWAGFRDWLTALGVEVNQLDQLENDSHSRQAWINEVVARFCRRFKTVEQYQVATKSGVYSED